MFCASCGGFKNIPSDVRLSHEIRNTSLCMKCYQRDYADRAEGGEEKDKERLSAVIAWETEWKAAMDSAEQTKLSALLQKVSSAKDTTSDEDDALCKRHVPRMESFLRKMFSGECKEMNTGRMKILLEAPIFDVVETKDVWHDFWVGAPDGEARFAAFDMLIEYPRMADALDNECLCERIYAREAKRWCEKLLQPRFVDADQIFVTQKHIKWAEHRMARTNGGKNPEKLALLEFLQTQMKLRSKRKAADRKAERDAEGEDAEPAAPEAPPPKRSTRSAGAAPVEEPAPDPPRKKAKTAAASEEAEAWECKLLGKMAGNDEMWLISAPKWAADRGGGVPSAWPEIWTCGFVDPRHPADHAAHSGAVCAAGHEACAALERQLATWKPEHFDDKWQAFIIRPETLAANSVSADDVCKAACTVLGAACHAPGEAPAKGLSSEMQTLALKDSRNTFFDQRFYYTFRVNTKELAKVKAATNHIKKMTEKNSCFFIQFAHAESCTVAPRCLIVGKTKPQYSDGGVLVVSFVDRDQDHYHHGSIKRRPA